MRKLFIAGNWKMNMTMATAIKFAEAIKVIRTNSDVEIAVIAPYIHLMTLKNIFLGTDIKVGAQNVYYEKKGAYTGEISPIMLDDIGTDYCVVGHSERREIFKEDDELINKKLKALLEIGIKPILCVGENLEIREKGETVSHVRNQLTNDLKDITKDEIKNITIAYEPIWAIGTGETATPNQAEEICMEIRTFLKEIYDENISDSILIQYGGSVKPDNAIEILKMPNIDGALIGGASLDTSKFIDIYNKAVFTKSH